MIKARTTIWLLLVIQAVVSAEGQSGKCDFAPLRNQQKDAATIRRLEMAWTDAYLHGDTRFMSCLLTPDFTEIMRSGELKMLSDELAMAEKNRGQELKTPELPKILVLLHENAAVAYGSTVVKSDDGKTDIRWYSDSYLWKDGRWHAFFAQQTSAPNRRWPGREPTDAPDTPGKRGPA